VNGKAIGNHSWQFKRDPLGSKNNVHFSAGQARRQPGKASAEPTAPHTLRHLTASEMAARGASLTDIQKVLGHERASTTDGYLQDLGFVSVRGAMLLLEDNETVAQDRTTGGGE